VGYATTSGYAVTFNTSTLVANAVTAQYISAATTASTQVGYATTSGYAVTFNTATLITTALTATNAAIAYSLAKLSSAVVIDNATSSTTTATGALVVLNGGVGIGGNVNIGGIITATNIYINGYQVSTSTSFNTSTLVANAVTAQYISAATTASTQVGYATTSGYAVTFNTGTLVANAVTAQYISAATTASTQVGYATTSGYAVTFNTSTLVALAVNIVNTSTTQVGYAANLLGGAAGNVVYQTAPNTSGFASNISYTNSGVASQTAATGQTFVVGSGGLGVTGASYFSTNVGIGGTLYLTGDLYVDGTQFIVNKNTISSGDQAIVLSTGSSSATLAQGAGLYIGATSATSYASFVYDGSANWVTGGSAGGGIKVAANTGASTTNTGALQVVNGGIGVGGGGYFGGTVTATNFILNGYQVSTGTINTSTLMASAVTATSAAIAYSLAKLSSAVVIDNATPSTTTATGALTVLNGGVGIGGALNVGSVGYFGINAAVTNLTNPSLVAKGVSAVSQSGQYYTQAALLNGSATGSADWIAYTDTYPGPSNDQGWVDMGITGANFSDPAYTLTGKQDGYIFVTSTSTAGNGNLVLATGGTGSANNIIFGTGGFLTANEKMRLESGGALDIGYTSAQSGAKLSVNGGAYVNGIITGTNIYVGIWPVSTSTTSTLVASAVTATSAAIAYSTIGSLTTGTGIYGTTFNGSVGVQWSLNTSTLVTTAVFAQYITAATTSTTQVGQAANVLGGAIGSIHYQSAANTTAMLANATTSGWVLGSVLGAAPSWQLVSTSTLVTTAVFAQYITAATTSTTQVGQAANVLGGAIGSIHYQSAANTTAMLANATTSGWVLGSVLGAAPSWQLAAAATATTATSAATAYSLATLSTAVIINLATGASSTNTGALQVLNGGVGIGGGIFVGGISTFTNTLIVNNATGASSTNTGALQVLNGGVGIGGGMVIAGIVTATNTLGVSSTITGAVRVAGGVGIGGGLFVGGTITATNLLVNGYAVSTSTAFNGGTITNPLIVNNATASTSTTTGAIQVVNGGIGVGGDVAVGNSFILANSTGTGRAQMIYNNTFGSIDFNFF
jgi:hypothetical protein